MTQSIKNKILAAQVSQILAAVLILGFSGYVLIDELHDSERLEHLQQATQYNCRTMETFLAHKQGIVERIALSDYVEGDINASPSQRLVKYLGTFSKELPTLALVTETGDEIVKVTHGVRSNTLVNVSNTEVFQRALKQPNTPVFAFPEGTVTSESLLAFAFARHLQNKCVGIVLGKVPIQVLSGQLALSDEHRKSAALFTNGQGEILAHTSPNMIGRLVPEAALYNELSKSPAIHRMDVLGQDSFVAMSTVPKRGYRSLAVSPVDASLAAPHRMKEQTAITLIVFTCVAYVVSVIISSSLSKPIMRLLKIAQQITAGNFHHRVTVKSSDEVGLLEQSFNDMLEHLENSTTSVEQLNQEIRQRELAEDRQAELLSQLEDTNNELKDFAYIVSHDLKAPLRGISTVASWLQEDYSDKLDDTGREHLGMLVRRAERMRGLIEGVLQYSRVSRAHEEIQAVDLHETLPEIIDLLAVPDNITVTINKPLPTVLYQATRLKQIFQNLLSNAIKYIDKPEGKIDIDYTEDETSWTFSLSDNGPGIDEKYFDKIFGIFQTLDSRDEYESTGVGLAIIKKAVEATGGRIWVTSQLGQGSTFSFTIPKTLESAPEENAEAPQEAQV
jgi:signal transduction histidine kinase